MSRPRPSPRPAVAWNIDLYDSSDECMEDCVKESFVRHVTDYDKYPFERPVDDDDPGYIIDEVERARLRDNYVASHLDDDEFRMEPIGSYITRKFYDYLAPPYFKRDHPDDDLFLKKLGDSQVPWRTQLKDPENADEPLIKDVVALIIWQDTKHNNFWKKLRQMSPPDQDDSLYSHIIRAASSLVYFLYTQANLFKIGHERTLEKQLDKIFIAAEDWAKKGTPLDEACKLLVKLMDGKDGFSLVTEIHLADMLGNYAYDSRCGFFMRPFPIKVILPSTDKDQLFDDITEVVRKEELSPAQLTADEYTHWMMMLVREEFTQVAYNLISRAMGGHPRFRLDPLSDDELSCDLFCLLLPLLTEAAKRIKFELYNVPLPLYLLCRLHPYKLCTEISETVQVKVCTEISEIVQVADLRRMSLGSRFISRSHIIWAFYKLGYALPLGIRNVMIKFLDSDEDHPPYHIYMAALKLALCSGEKTMQLDHFIYAVLNSKESDFDGEQWTEIYQDFKDFQQALESMETEIEPKSTVTVRPCGSLNIFSDSRDDSHETEESTANIEPKSSENSGTDTGDAEESIIQEFKDILLLSITCNHKH